MNLMTLLEMAAESGGDRVAIGSRHDGITYRQLLVRALATAERFRTSQTDRVVLCDESSTAVPIALFGAAAASMPYVPLNYRLADDDLRRLCSRSAPAVAITGAANAGRLSGIEGIRIIERQELLDRSRRNSVTRDTREIRARRMEPSLRTGPTSGIDDATLMSADPAGWTASGDPLADHDTADPLVDHDTADPDDIAVLLFTSGTTGEPKSAVLRHRHLVSYIIGSVELMGAGPGEATIVSVPPYHIAGVAAVLSSVYAGRRIVPLPRFDPDHWIDTVADEGVTHAMVVPTMLARIVDALDARGGEPMLAPATLSYGGGRMPLRVIQRALELFPITSFVNAYGLTETSSTVALLGPDDHRLAQYSDDPAARRRLASAGRVLPGIEVAIRDDGGADLPVDTPGEIFVRGSQISGEYLGHPPALVDGWFPTRDGGYLDAEGYLFVTGRNDDVIIRGGENLSPGEIEDVVLTHPDVRDAAAVGVPSTEWGEKPVLIVVPADGRAPIDGTEPANTTPVTVQGRTTDDGLADALKDLLRSRLRSVRVPEHVVFVAELPYSETGKLLRRVLRDEFAYLGDMS